MTKYELGQRDAAINAFLQEFGMDFFETVQLVDRLRRHGNAAHANAENLWIRGDYEDRSYSICNAVRKTLNTAGLGHVNFAVSRNPCGLCLKIMMPSGRHNSMGGKEDGWGF